MTGGEDVVWEQLLGCVEQIVDGEVFRCIELLSLKEQAQVAQLVRSLLRGQLERARGARINAVAVLETMNRVVGPVNSDLMAMARGAAASQGAASSQEPAVGSMPAAAGKKRRRVEFSSTEDEDEFLRLAELGEVEPMMALLESSSQPRRLLSCTSEGGLTALHHAAFNGYEVLARRLLEAQADPNRKSDYGFSVVMAATQSRNVALLTTVLEARGLVNVRADFDGRTALHLCCSSGDVDVAQVLLRASADPQLKDNKGKTPVDKAREQNHDELVRVLELTRDSEPQTDPRQSMRCEDIPVSDGFEVDDL
mmetsp:Transcript_33068/g.71985  ORF Transcript_33068/g.71985 Transcript_33068/m.71985 type:complete len:310 (+) Transcript_33068:86-1015(+)|eukprot:CAMPEP_0170572490 /NCGR_PEP_ID=MMETSP0224-20130122/2243_1 /TAXON_ID=285029 /ORGANISM="Togula jolla, Strain CCCM 725" /LENGTH=309 /DNA_ID=CAMNT_0010894981 /DNA_START=22 /DNA_END=951 /DNA_ORIENTATION=-